MTPPPDSAADLRSPEGADPSREDLLSLLRSRITTAETVARIGRNRSWMRSREVKLAFASNAKAPQVLARQVLPHLGWRDLAELSVNARVSPLLRREAERLLRTRLPELTVGEKVSLARRGSRGVVEMLRDAKDARVLRAVAGNPRSTESDLDRILARTDVPSTFLAWLADQSSWSQRRTVRLALVRHPSTPSSSALHLIPALSRRDIEVLEGDFAAPRLVRVAAGRILGRAGSGATSMRFG